jgi:hypothetical protein
LIFIFLSGVGFCFVAVATLPLRSELLIQEWFLLPTCIYRSLFICFFLLFYYNSPADYSPLTTGFMVVRGVQQPNTRPELKASEVYGWCSLREARGSHPLLPTFEPSKIDLLTDFSGQSVARHHKEIAHVVSRWFLKF